MLLVFKETEICLVMFTLVDKLTLKVIIKVSRFTELTLHLASVPRPVFNITCG